MSETHVNLMDGGNWAEHEYCIVGSEAGLQNLIKACEIALENYECFDIELGDYVGVKRFESSWFENPTDSNSFEAKFLGLGCVILSLATILCTCIGVVTVARWIFT
jgi:hypothetical protein